MTTIFGNGIAGATRGVSAEVAQRQAFQRTMIGHGSLMIACALLGGVGLWMYLLGGFEIIPGYILHLQLPGSAEG